MAKTKMYLHSSKESNYDLAEELGIKSEKALDVFKYSLYEVEFEVDVNKKTGEVTILKVKCGEQTLVPA